MTRAASGKAGLSSRVLSASVPLASGRSLLPHNRYPSFSGVSRACYSWSCARRAHTVRAFLCAHATAARLCPRRARRALRQRRRSSSLGSSPRSGARAPGTHHVRRELWPRWLTPRSRGMPPGACSRGTHPSQAAPWRPFLHGGTSPIAARRAVAVTGPLPGMVCKR